MNIQKRTNIIIALLVLLIISTIFTINYLKERTDPESDEVLKCIAENSILIVSKTCSHCANQKLILGEGLKYFEMIDVADHPEVWDEYDLLGVPAWIIGDEIHYGTKEIKTLKDLTEC